MTDLDSPPLTGDGYADVRATSELVTYYRNPRRGDIEAIAASLARNAQYRPIVVNSGTRTGRRNEVLAGNHTLLAARRLNWPTIQTWTIDVDDDTAARIVAADNRTADLGTYDEAELVELLKEIAAQPDGLFGTGYSDDDLVNLLKRTVGDNLPPGEFPAYDDETMPTEYRCPQCGYEWSGKPA